MTFQVEWHKYECKGHHFYVAVAPVSCLKISQLFESYLDAGRQLIANAEFNVEGGYG